MRFVPPRAMRRSVARHADSAHTEPAEQTVAALVTLSYELLDAHADTARLASDEATDAEWQSHLAYLRDLQRVGREALARAALPAAH